MDSTRKQAMYAITLGLTIAGAPLVHAQRGPTESYAERGITLRERTLRVDFGPAERGINDSGSILGQFSTPYGVRFGEIRVHDDVLDETFEADDVRFGFGLAYGIRDDLEFGVLLAPVISEYGHGRWGNDDDGDGFGDITPYIRYRFVDGDFQLGIQGSIAIPTGSEFGFGVGLPMSAEIGRHARLETGVELEFYADDDDTNDEADVDVDIPLAITADIGEHGFLGGRSGVTIFIEPDFVAWPLQAHGGVSFGGSKVSADLTAEFQYQFFFDDDDTTDVATWHVLFGGNLHFGL